jgi:methionyl aminopeptidase
LGTIVARERARVKSMSIETEQDLQGLTRAGSAVSATLRALEQAVAPGMTTAELDEIARRVLDERGARATPKHEVGFPGHVCISINDEAVHGIPSDRRIEADDVVKLDVTADLDGYVADAARTVVVAARSASRQRLAHSAHSAFRCGLDAARAGRRTDDIGGAIDREV